MTLEVILVHLMFITKNYSFMQVIIIKDFTNLANLFNFAMFMVFPPILSKC